MKRLLSVLLHCGIVYLFSSATPILAQEYTCPVPTPTPTPEPTPTPTPEPTPEPTPDPCNELHEELIEEGDVYWTCNYGNCNSGICTEWIGFTQTNYYQEYCADGTPWGEPYAKTRSGTYEGRCDECSCCEGYSAQSSALQDPSDVIHSVNYSDGVTYSTLEDLAKASRLILVGTPVSHREYLTKDGRSITSDYSVTIQEVLKGDVRSGVSIEVSVPGGWHRFSDGKKFVVRTPDQRPVVEGETYLFFLRGPSDTARGYAPSGGGQGLFELHTRARIARFSSSEQSSVGTVRTTTRIPPFAAKYTGMPVERFLDEVRQALEKDHRARQPMKIDDVI